MQREDFQKQYICIGKIRKPFGRRRGDFHCELFVDQFSDIREVQHFYIKNDDEFTKISRLTFQQHGASILCTIDSAQAITEETPGLTNKKIYIKRSSLPDIKDEEYYVFDLIGLEAFFGGKYFGVVVDVPEYGSCTMLCVEVSRRKCYIPFFKKYIRELDLAKKRIQFRDIEGFLDI